MNLLYISCHAVAEWDECTLFSKIPGINVRSIGAYADPRVGNDMRPAIPTMEYSEDHMQMIRNYEPDHILTEDLCEWSDVIIFMHLPDHIRNSRFILDKFPGKPIYYRSIGQSSDTVEQTLHFFQEHFGSRFRIIRYSPNEQFLPNYCGLDYLIRFYKDPEEFKDWKGDGRLSINRVNPGTYIHPDFLTINNGTTSSFDVLLALQAAGERGVFGHFEQLEWATKDFTRLLIGPRNEGYAHKMFVDNPSYEDYKKVLQAAPVFMYGGMIPASYTLTFIEAMMTGVPIVSISGGMWAAEHQNWCPPAVFEADTIIDVIDDYGMNAHWYTTPNWESTKELLDYVLADSDLMRAISRHNRSKAIELFGIEKIKEQWQALLSQAI